MDDFREPVEMDQALRAALRADRPARTAECLEPDELLMLIDGNERETRHASRMAHIAECRYCRRQYVAMRQDLLEAERLRSVAAQSPTASPSPSPPESLWKPAKTWLDRLATQAMTALDTLWTPKAAFAFSTQEVGTLRKDLRFDDERALGSYSVEGDSRWIHVEHQDWPVGTLILLEALDEQDRVHWRRFAVLRSGWKKAVAELDAGPARIDNCHLHVGRVAGSALPAESATDLRSSFLQACQEDPAAPPAWGEWATKALETDLEPAIGEVARWILAGGGE